MHALLQLPYTQLKTRPVACSVAPPATSCVLLPGVDRKKLLQDAQHLEAAAAAAHAAAQELNKEGRYEEAKAKYAEMRRLDAEALQITRQLGCQQCMPPTAAGAAGLEEDAAAAADVDEREAAARAVYEQRHTPQASPHSSTHAVGGLTPSDRARGSIVASLVCDAAATGVQWIYDTDLLDQLLQLRQQAAADVRSVGLEFMDPVQSPFLAGYSAGRNGPYGEQSLLLLQSLAQQGALDCRHYAALYYESYSQGFEGYMNASTVAFLRTYSRGLRPPATGADDSQADCITSLAPLVAMYAGDERLMQLVAAVTQVTQDTAAAVCWACAGAAVLERVVLGGCSTGEAVQETVQEIRQEGPGRMSVDRQVMQQVAGQLERVLLLQDMPHAEAVEQLGRNCHLPNSCQTPLHAVLYHEHRWQQQQQQAAGGGAGAAVLKQQVLVAAVRDALAAGGCCASRSNFVGACMGALLGVEAVPQAWLDKYEAAARVQALADQVCASRSVKPL